METPYLHNQEFAEDVLEEPWVLKEKRCGCGRYETFDECNICDFGQIKVLWEKTHECAKLLIKREVLNTRRIDDAAQVKKLLKWFSKMDEINILRHLHADLSK